MQRAAITRDYNL